MDAEQAFQQEMVNGADLLKSEIGYNPTRWLQMIGAHGAVDAAKRLLTGPRASDGFTTLWESGRLDMSVEFAVLKPEYEHLFNDAERAEARRRLELYEYDFDAYLSQAAGGSVANDEPTEDVNEEPSLDAISSPPEAGPVVVPISSSDKIAVWPTAEDLTTARKLFGEHEPRDIFYRAANDLVALAREGRASVSVAEALAVLLQTWNRPFYQFRKFSLEHFEAIEDLLVLHDEWLQSVRDRSIKSLEMNDQDQLELVFHGFEMVLGPVGAAKALHLLAPRFLPLWDRAIAVAYGLELGRTGTNGRRYWRLAQIAKEQISRLNDVESMNLLKAIDEYNYCHFSRGWM